MRARLPCHPVAIGYALVALTWVWAFPSLATANAPLRSQLKTAALLFVVQGTGGSYTDEGNGAAMLALTGISEQMTWFNDRPERQAGTTTVANALDLIGFDKVPPNAVLTVPLADAHHDALAVQLETPRYDEANATLTFAARLLRNHPGPGLTAYRPELDKGLDSTFAEFSLFIDDARVPIGSNGEPLPPKASPNDKTYITVSFAAFNHIGWGVVNIKAVYDDYNNCVEGDADSPGRFDAGRDQHAFSLGVTIRGNPFTTCGWEHSRMHWLISSGDGRTSYVQLDAFAGDVIATCGPQKDVSCYRDYQQPAVAISPA